MELITYLLAALVIVLSYIAYNLYTKLVKYETWIVERRQDSQDLKSTLQELDTLQMFEKDDEVGVLFEEVGEIINEYNRKVIDE